MKNFLNTYGTKDRSNMEDSDVELLMDDHFYYIEIGEDPQGWFIPEDISGLTKQETYIHDRLYNDQQ